MRKPVFIALGVVLLVLAAGSGWYWWTDWRFLQSTDDAYVQSDVSLISPKIEGYIKEIRVRDNEAGAAGQILFVIDERDFECCDGSCLGQPVEIDILDVDRLPSTNW